MKIEDIHQRLVSRFGDAIRELKTGVKDPWIEVAVPAIADVSEFLRTDPELKFEAPQRSDGGRLARNGPEEENALRSARRGRLSPLQLFAEALV